jgi:ABC-type transporter Mla maintaining outer membrane lipid asymmetry ATPase subunit MlaF
VSTAIAFTGVIPAVYDPDWTTPLTMDVPEGSFQVIRTTPLRSAPFMRLCVGLFSPGSGTIAVLGEDPGSLRRAEAQRFRRSLGVAMLPDGLISNLSMRMNIVVPLVYSGKAHVAEATRMADAALAECGLAKWANNRPASIPPDVRQLAVVARAIAHQPRLLLLEDPFSSVKSRDAVALAAVCRNSARTVVIATHRRNEALYRFADRTAFWDDRGYQVDNDEVGSS